MKLSLSFIALFLISACGSESEKSETKFTSQPTVTCCFSTFYTGVRGSCQEQVPAFACQRNGANLQRANAYPASQRCADLDLVTCKVKSN